MNEDPADPADPADPFDRAVLVERWFALTRDTLPALAQERGWPVRFDHCFQRILLDHATGGPWRETIAAPAYRNASNAQLGEAVRLGERAVDGREDMGTLNRQSLRWRGKL